MLSNLFPGSYYRKRFQEMEDTQLPHVIYACYSQKNRQGEQFIPAHIFSLQLTGVSDMHIDGKTYRFAEGEFRFVRRNKLASYTKWPAENGLYESLAISMDQQTLQEISEAYDLHPDKPYTGESVLKLRPHPLFQNYFESLRPYQNGSGRISETLTGVKVREAVMILLEVYPELKNVLFDFSEPGKIDLEAFMNTHYRYNVDISRFAYLTGRSLASFKRDFEKVFHTSPNKWLQQKRLEEAYFLLKERKQKVGDVYLDVGFKDLSHFSFAFKKAFGMPPSQLA